VADLIGDRTSVGRTLNSMTAPTDERKPVTVLFTNLVESTERAARSISHQGDARSIQAALNITVPFIAMCLVLASIVRAPTIW